MPDLPLVSSARLAARYELREIVGHGGLALIYRAWDHQLERFVAVKMMREAGADSRKLIEHAWREAMTTACLHHPNIVTVFDYGIEEGNPFVVMELIEGESLEDCLERGPLHCQDFHRFADESLQGLGAAHGVGLVHRDIKPANFMLQNVELAPFRVKILDFGLARYLTSPRPQTVDRFNSLMGSIHYMAPEQFLNEPIDQRTDIYSMGCILYETLTGHAPFDGETTSALIDSHVSHAPASIIERRPDVPPLLEAWIFRLMSKNPDDRPPSSDEALESMPSLEAV